MKLLLILAILASFNVLAQDSDSQPADPVDQQAIAAEQEAQAQEARDQQPQESAPAESTEQVNAD